MIDLYGEPRLAELLSQLETVPGIDWIRLMYFYPMYVSDELIATIASSRKIVPYLDMPLQHINDTMLRRMARRVTRQETESLLTRMRKAIPNLALRTTFITGCPGETDEQFQELVEFVESQRFERVGVFTYSYEPDTPAALLPNQVPAEVMNERRNRLMEAQQRISAARNQQLVGSQVEVIIDQAVPGEDNVWIGRTPGDAPDVDGAVFVTGDQWKLKMGSIVLCEIVATQEYDLVAVALAPGR